MVAGDAHFNDGTAMFGGAIAPIALPAIGGMNLGQALHNPVPGDLGHDGGCGNGQGNAVAADDRLGTGLKAMLRVRSIRLRSAGQRPN